MKQVYRYIIGIIFFYVIVPNARAQVLPGQPPPTPPPIAQREVSGIVLDSDENPVPFASLKLTSLADTLQVKANEEGIFKFINVKSATYTLNISSLGFTPFVGRFKQNDALPRIVMDPIVLRKDAYDIQEVVISGRPPIIFKTDTVEFTASNYIIRANDTVDDLLKQMEGMYVNRDGELSYQGQKVEQAKLNGKVFIDGDVSSAIRNLPAEIVSKIQIVDDYGDQAKRTSIKSGDPTKVLNIFTKTEKSVGNMANLKTEGGNKERYDGSLVGTRINGNRTLGINAQLNNTVLGLPPKSFDLSNLNSLTNAAGAQSGGNNRNNRVALSIQDQLFQKIDISGVYTFSNNKIDAFTNSTTQQFGSLGNILTTLNQNNVDIQNGHSFNLDLETDITPKNYLKITSQVNLSNIENQNGSESIQTGLYNQGQNTLNNSTGIRPFTNLSLLYQYFFNKPKRNFSLQLSRQSNRQEEDKAQQAEINYLLSNSNIVVKDSLFSRLFVRENKTTNLRSSATFVEPLGEKSQLEFNAQTLNKRFDNLFNTYNSNLNTNILIDSLSNVYDYKFNQARLSANYRVWISKVNMSLGATAIPTRLQGANSLLKVSVDRRNLNIVPIVRINYSPTQTQNIGLNYNGNAMEPSFEQLLPIRNVSNPQFPVVGNPDLKIAFHHSAHAFYNIYLPNSRWGFSTKFTGLLIKNQIASNIIQISDVYNSFINETRFVNVNGAYRLNGDYNITKQLNNRKYNLNTSGNFYYNKGMAFSNNLKSETNTWNYTQMLGAKIKPLESVEVNPTVAYRFISSENTLPSSIPTNTKIWALQLDGRVFLSENIIWDYDISKSFIDGNNTQFDSNPLILNTGIKLNIGRKYTLGLQAYDLLNQNNFLQRNIGNEFITDVVSNRVSRYVLFRFAMSLQKWSAFIDKSGGPVKRRGDGSFIP